MKNEIKKLNLMYGLSAIDIFSQYPEFKPLKGKKIKEVSKIINNYYIWLEQQDNINALNVILVGKELLKNSNIRSCILKNDDNLLKKLSLQLIKNIDFENINEYINSDECLFINYSSNEDVEIHILKLEKYINNKLENSNLLFKDLIQVLLNNFDFSRQLKKINHSTGYYLNSINTLNYIYYHLALYFNTTRQDLYYASLWLLQYPNISSILFPRSYISGFKRKDVDFETGKLIELGIIRGLHYLNLYYYIEIPDFNYKNIQKNISSSKNSNDEREDTLFQYISSVLTVENKIFLYKIAFVDRNYTVTESDTKELNNLINSLKKLDNIIIVSQNLSSKKQKLIEDTISFIQEYSTKNNIKLLDFVYCPNPVGNAYLLFLEFYITYNDFKYKISIRKYNDKLMWIVNLKNKKTYKINLYLPEDFKHILQSIYND